MQVIVTVTGLDETDTHLGLLTEKLHDFTAALTTLGAMLIQFYGQDVFISSGQALGDTWANLAPATQAEKDKDWPGRSTLVRTGELQDSFYSEVSPMSLYVSNNARTNDGTSLFAIHQLGTGDGPGRGHNIPARPMIGINSTVSAMIETVIKADIAAKIEASRG